MKNMLETLERRGAVHFKGKGGSSGTTSTTQTSEPWTGQAHHLLRLYDKATGLPYKSPPPRSTVPEHSIDTRHAIHRQRQRSLGSPIETSATKEIDRTLRGHYLYGGQGFDAALDAAKRDILPEIQSQFARSGRYGSGLAQEAQAQALADAFAGQYGQERQRQMQGLQLTPAFQAMDYRNIEAQRGVGAQQEELSQARLREAADIWRERQNAPYERLAAQSAAIQGGFTPGRTQSSQPYYRNRFAEGLSSGLTGSALGFGMGGIPGAAIGGGLGLLGGMLF